MFLHASVQPSSSIVKRRVAASGSRERANDVPSAMATVVTPRMSESGSGRMRATSAPAASSMTVSFTGSCMTSLHTR